MTPSSSSSTYPGGEGQRFSVLLGRLIDAILNSLFDVRPQVATIRLYLLLFIFFLSGFVISLIYYPLPVWLDHFQDVFGYLFNPNYPPNYPGNPFENLVYYTYQAFTDPRVLQYLPILLAPFFIALQTAANYLADVFELEDPGIARHFVSAVALTGSNQTMRITQGDVLEEHKVLPIRLIGGPGRVLVDMDSVALFEKPDGTPRVIGPTTRGKAKLDGFERFRQAIDLRNQTIELRDNDGKSAAVTGRSLDGIPITAADVCFVFTVHRNGQTPSVDNPFPFSEEAVEKLVYKATSQVRPDLPNPSKFEPSWTGGMAGLIRSKLGGFMSDHKLAEYLASFGQPEVDRLNQGEAETVDALKSLTSPADADLPEARKLQVRPSFISRDQIKFNLFDPFAAEFTKAQSDRGVELHWIGTGAWLVPTEIVPETRAIPPQFIEAWKTSHENLEKLDNLKNGVYEKDTTIQKFVSLIQEIPVARHVTATTKSEREQLMSQLLDSYRSQFIQTAEFMNTKGQPVPPVIKDAIKCLNKVLGIGSGQGSGIPPGGVGPGGFGGRGPSNMPNDQGSLSGGSFSPGGANRDQGQAPIPDGPESFGGGGPSAASKQETTNGLSEEILNLELLSKVGFDRAEAERLVEIEQKHFPNESRRKWIERAIDHLYRNRK
jgi:hypothetical protein